MKRVAPVPQGGIGGREALEPAQVVHPRRVDELLDEAPGFVDVAQQFVLTAENSVLPRHS